jgi:asparagine synthase (glutamine-hydrolysing)
MELAEAQPRHQPLSGFRVTYRPSTGQPVRADSGARNLAGLAISISHDGIERIVTDRDHLALVDGYVLGVSMERLVAALESHEDSFLSSVHGAYCALIIHPSGDMWGFCDRFGARTLFWQTTPRGDVTITSRWESMPVYECQWDDMGLGEILRYRWLTGQSTLIRGISRLPHWHRVSFRRDGDISVLPSAQQPFSPTQYVPGSFREKLDETRSALTVAVEEMAQCYDKAAIFVSGGVDSSLLAALAKSAFEECLLVTPVFVGENNPELGPAKAVAETLHLEHLLVDVDTARFDKDLRELAPAKAEQINFHLLAMHQMIEAIPDEYQLLIYGQGADNLFGSDPYKRTEKLLRWKRYADFLPDLLSPALSRLPISKARGLSHLKQASVADVILEIFAIPYDPKALAIIRRFYDADLDGLYAHQAVSAYLSGRDCGGLRGLLQDINLRSRAPTHYREAELSASRFGKRVFAPFLAAPVVEVAKTLTRDQYFGKKFAKPILREIACEHFDRALIYKKKRGFAVPYVSWLKGPLAHLVDAARRERDLFDGEAVGALDVEGHYPVYWSLIHWQLANEQVMIKQQETSNVDSGQPFQEARDVTTG